MADISKISPDNGTTIYNLKDIEARKRVPEVLLKDTVGWTGKNLAKKISLTGQTTQYADVLRLEADMQASTVYILSFVSDGVYSLIPNSDLFDTQAFDTIAGQNEVSLTTKSSISRSNSSQYYATDGVWRVLKSDIALSNAVGLTNIMLRKADISDSTYEPYHESVEEIVGDIRAEQAVLGAKNLLPNNASTQTLNGVTFTVNDDGTVTANGTASANISLFIDGSGFNYSNGIDIPKGIVANTLYTLTDGLAQDSASKYVRMVFKDSSGTNVYALRSDNAPIGITPSDLSSLKLLAWISISNGTTLSNEVFKPMLRLASDPDDTYVPYAMTNREITEELTVQESEVTDIVSGASVGSLGNHLLKTGNVVTLDLELSGVVATANDTILFKVPQGFRPKYLIELDAVSGNVTGYLTDTGNYKVRSNISNGIIRMHGTWITT